MAYRIQQLKLGGILDQAVAITKDHFGLLFSIMVLLFIPANLIAGYAQIALLPPRPTFGSPPEVIQAYNEAAFRAFPVTMGITLLLLFVVMPLTNAAVINAVARLYLGQQTTAVESIKYGLSRLMPLIWTSILMGLAIMGGLILLIIPGILLAFWFSLSTHVVVIEGISGGAALKRSKELVRPNMGTMIVLGLLLGGINFGVGLAVGIIPQPYLQLLVHQVVIGIMTIFGTAAFVVFYFSCRCGVENFDLQYLAESIGAEANLDEGQKDEEW
ncbi:MAG: hypothetical protein KDA86_23280 [Planctomycetaceae bacterium]|nr:hypothetical protein [Planctomycetaceae bacterium]